MLTELFKFTVVKLVQLANAFSPNDVIVLGIVTSCKLVQPENAQDPIDSNTLFWFKFKQIII